MKRNLIITTLIISFMLLSCAPTTSAGGLITGADVYSLANYNCYLTDLGYHFETKTLYFVAQQDTWINESIGLGLLIIKFKLDRAPDFKKVSANINGMPAKDMLKNYTLMNGSVQIIEENSTYILECKYLQIFFYIFENHTIINEQQIETNIGPLWNSTQYIPAQRSIDPPVPIPEPLPPIRITVCPNDETETPDTGPSYFIPVIGASLSMMAILIVSFKKMKRK